jgi:AAA+ superfamily predicted ATPase
MNDSTLAGLRAALAASPDNATLLSLILQGLAQRKDHVAGLQLLSDRPPGELDAKGCLAAAQLLDLASEPDRGMAYYQTAVADSPTLEDLDLEARLQASPTPPKPGRPQLRVLSSGRLEGQETPVETLFDAPRETVCFADVGGLDDLKKRIRRKVMLPMQKPSLFKRFRKRAGGGVLLYGPPGCGKTLMARATAGECGATFFNVAISDVLDMWFGESEHKLHEIFEKARANSPSVLFFDEVEAIGGRRNHAHAATSANLVSQFLSEMDGFDGHNQGVLILGATNVPWAVDPAFRRPGRFDRVLFVPPPDRPAREAILQIHLADRPLDRNVKIAPLAKKTSGYSGADLEELVETAADLAIEASIEADQEVPISQAHLIEALSEVRATTTEWLTTARNYARYANEGGQYDEVLAFLGKHGKH